MDLAGRSVLVLGLGRTGRSAADFCVRHGARVTIADERTAPAPGDELPEGVELRLGLPFPDPAGYELVVPSPGVPAARYAERARRVAGDIELAGAALSVPIVAVTGTNGKSTTVTLLAAMLRAAGWRAEAAGNLGTPALSLVGRPLDCAILEVSSFQLEAVEHFRPHVAVWLNLTPDHLDRHGSVAGYTAAKRRLFEQQTTEDWAVVNDDDPLVRAATRDLKARRLAFRTRGPVEQGASLDGSSVLLATPGGTRRIQLDGALPGGVDRENVLAAIAAVQALGADPERALTALASYTGLPHRCERVGPFAGVCFVNDSKATNVGAAIRALERFEAPVLWIAGGRDKGLDFAPLAEAARGRVRCAWLIGEAADALEAALAGQVPTRRAESLEQAVREAADEAKASETVLLSPACASYDQFQSFEERGDRFRQAAHAWAAAREARP